MAHTVLWPKKTFFYPIGNTPPVCFTRQLSSEKNADILLLACGDPRSILYTIYADHAPKYREMDFTCCDWEPAILARNTLLLTMIVDGVSDYHAWSIFYNFFLDDKSYNILLEQCRVLIRVSSDMQTWKNSKYGGHIKFCTEHTLEEVKRHWNFYLEHDRSSAAEKNAIKTSFLVNMKRIREKYGGSGSPRSAGPLALEFAINVGKHRDKFWETGVISSKPSQATSTPQLNPTFAYCQAGKAFNVHYGTDPLSCFFIAPAYAFIQGTETASLSTYEREVETAVNQFSSWCSSFKDRILSVGSPKFVIRFFLGESLAFCHALYTCRRGKLAQTGVYTLPWGNKQINLDPDEYDPNTARAPLIYNVIETSNLTDHVGLLNILLVTVPLLRKGPSSILHTDTLVNSSRTGIATSGLSSKGLADIPSLSIFLGVAPALHLSHFTTFSNKHEILAAGITSGQLLEPLSWKYPLDPSRVFEPDSDPRLLICEPNDLAQFLFGVYQEMFSDENWSNSFADPRIDKLDSLTNIHYVRSSLATFFAFVRERVQVDWTRVMDKFNDLIVADRTMLVGMNNYQDLACQLYLRGLFDSLDTFRPNFLKSLPDPSGLFVGWKDIPPIVCIVLKVPRAKLKRLEAIDSDAIGTPILQCEVRTPQGHSVHPSIQPGFGDLQVSYQSGEPAIDIHADDSAWRGNSSLIVTFYMNSWILLRYDPKSIVIGFHIRSTPSSAMLFAPIFGLEMTVFSTNLTDKNHLYVVRHRPNNVGEVERRRNLSTSNLVRSTQTSSQTSLNFDKTGRKVTHISVRETVKETDAARSLSAGASVTSQPVSDVALQVSFTDFHKRFVYPFPIKVDQIKTRIARKSSYVEIEAPIRVDFQDTSNVSLDPFPSFFNKDRINISNIHYINIDVLPSLKIPIPKSKLQWLSIHLGMMLSDSEKERQKKTDMEDHGVVVNLKESIGTIFLKYSGFDDPQYRPKVYGLSNFTNGVGIWLLIFVNDIKLDLSSHTVIVDACVVPLHDGMMGSVRPLIQKLMDLPVLQIRTDDDETRLWKKLLPVLAERCRTWKHTSECEYIRNGVPVPTLESSVASLLCSCGKGKDLGAFGTMQEWKRLHSQATRVAICPLFTFSFMEDSMSSMTKEFEEKTKINNTDLEDSTTNSDLSESRCASCRGPGNPTLLNCGSCKKIKYCSRSCQKAHWKIHKPRCASS